MFIVNNSLVDYLAGDVMQLFLGMLGSFGVMFLILGIGLLWPGVENSLKFLEFEVCYIISGLTVGVGLFMIVAYLRTFSLQIKLEVTNKLFSDVINSNNKQ